MLLNPTPGFQKMLKNGISNTMYRWTSNRLPFKISGSFSSSQKSMIRTATANIGDNTGGCLVLEEVQSAPSSGNYVDVVNYGSGCWSYVGMTGGRQELHLENGCFLNGIIEHEFLHALGVQHEQSRDAIDIWDLETSLETTSVLGNYKFRHVSKLQT